MNTYIPEGYKSLLGVYDTQKAIGLLKRLFEDQLAANLNLFRVSAPLFLEESSGLNDNLNGYERPVSFDILQTGREAQVVQSLAKWKRMALYRYDFYPGKGLYTDMNAIRRDEDVLDNLHSVYVDQWDWEKVIERRDRNLDYLKSTVMDIVAAVCETQRTMRAIYPQLQVLPELERQVTFITAQELEDRYPNLTPKEREHAFVREHHTTFIIGIGGALSGLLTLENGQLATQHTMLLILSLALGALIGEALNIEKHLEDFGVFCQNRLKSHDDSHFVEGFVSFSLLICIGAMAIVGSMQDGLSGDPSMLIAKAIIDGIAAVVFAASLGKGVFLSVLPLGVYQGAITLLARFIRPWMTDALIEQMSCVGSVLIFAVSLNMIRKDKIKVGNLLPAVFLPAVFYLLARFFPVLDTL